MAIHQNLVKVLIAVGGLLIVMPLTNWLESSMTTHVLVEIPLLIALGALLGVHLNSYKLHFLSTLNHNGIPGILVTSFTLAFWMIPRWLDSSLESEWVAISKYLSLILLAGLPLALSWHRLHPVARGVVKIELLSMLLRLGWLYLISPQRFCNNYLLADQIWLGRGFLALALVLSVYWIFQVFFNFSPIHQTVKQ